MHRGTRSSRGAVSWKLILSLLTAISSSVGLAAPLCKLAKVVYKPSAYETAWHSNVDEWSRKDPCSPVPGAAAGAVDCWLRYAAEANNNTGWPRDAGCAGVMSEFEYTYDCSGEGTVKKVDYIEPLAVFLRHPKAKCNDPNDTWLFPKDFLVFGAPHRMPGSGSRSLLFDLGASRYDDDEVGGSQGYLVSHYAAKGVDFDRILAFEASPSPRNPLNRVPRRIWHAYSYYNTRVSSDPRDPANPLNMLMRMARPEDFVAFKLDIDSNAIEEPLVEQILTNPNLTNLVDEFFFEYHVKYGPVEQHWQWTANQAKSLRDSYDLFATMRKRGIRAHGWP